MLTQHMFPQPRQRSRHRFFIVDFADQRQNMQAAQGRCRYARRRSRLWLSVQMSSICRLPKLMVSERATPHSREAFRRIPS